MPTCSGEGPKDSPTPSSNYNMYSNSTDPFITGIPYMYVVCYQWLRCGYWRLGMWASWYPPHTYFITISITFREISRELPLEHSILYNIPFKDVHEASLLLVLCRKEVGWGGGREGCVYLYSECTCTHKPSHPT